MKVFAICALCILLSGCFMSHKEVAEATSRCNMVGGTVSVEKSPKGLAITVRCIIDGVTYMSGAY